MPPKAPTAAASVGVASPNRIAPSTDRIRIASGKNACSSMIVILTAPMSATASFGSLGISFGFSVARTIT